VSPSLPATSRAVFLDRCSDSDLTSFALRTVPVPSLQSDELLIRVEAVSINPIDVWTRAGYGKTLLALSSPLPRIAGRDATGVVLSAGQSVWKYKVSGRTRGRRRRSTTAAVTHSDVVSAALQLRSAIAFGSAEIRSDTERSQSLSQYKVTPTTDRHTAVTTESAAQPVAVLVAHSAPCPLWPLVLTGRECSLAPSLLPLSSAACYPFIWTTLWTALVDRADVRPSPVSRLQATHASSVDELHGHLRPSAFVHGAGGPLGGLAVQTLHRWGFAVTATIKAKQDPSILLPHARHIITTDAVDDRRWRGRPASSSSASSDMSPLTPPSWLPSVSGRGCYRVFLDCVGGSDMGRGSESESEGESESESEGESAARLLLQPGIGHYVTLRGRLVSETDNAGVLTGGWRALSALTERKAAFAALGLQYDVAINRCNTTALTYLANCLDTHSLHHYEKMMHRPSQHSQEATWRGIERLMDALHFYSQCKPQGKVVVMFTNEDERTDDNAYCISSASA
jgi:NADPH:quinone reductase-like Zn-dependent oxidoreductase